MKRLILALAFLPAIAGFADEFDVNTVEDLYAKVGTAGDGDVINVAPGTYKMTDALGTLVIDKGITVQSTGSWRDTFFEPEEGLTDMRLLKIAHAKGLFKGFTLRNVTSTANMTGMAVYIDDPGGGTISDCRITNCSGSGTRYVVKMSVGSKMRRCRIDGNSATAQIIMSAGSSSKSAGTTLVSNCLIAGNTGTGLYWSNVTYLSPKIINCTVIDNGGSAAASFERESMFYNSVFARAATGGYALLSAFAVTGNRATQYVYNNYFIGPLPTFVAGKAQMGNNTVAETPMSDFADVLGGDYRPVAGSALLDAGRADADNDGVDIDGRPRGETHTLGCFEYDPDYTPSPTVVEVAAGADFAAAIADAPVGSTVKVAAGEFGVGAQITVDKPVHIVGAGRGKTVVRATGRGYRLMEIKNFKAVVEGMTFTGASGTGVRIANGGGELVGCRVTECGSSAVSFGPGSVLRNTIVDYNRGTGVHLIGDPVSGSMNGLIESCQITGNRGHGIYANKDEFKSEGTVVRRCTIADCATYYAVAASRQLSFDGCIVETTTKPGFAADKTDLSLASGSSCGYSLFYSISGITPSATCVTGVRQVGFVNPTCGDYHLTADSPARGKASDGGDLGCWPYDENYVPSYPVVNLEPGDDIPAAVAAAGNGTEIRLAEGDYTLPSRLVFERAVRLVGAGIDKSVIRVDPGVQALYMSNTLAEVRGVTIRDFTTGAVNLAYGGTVEECRITGGNYPVDGTISGFAAYLTQGTLSRSIVDCNTNKHNRDTTFVYVTSRRTLGSFQQMGQVENTLVVNNWAGTATNKRYGTAVYLTRSDIESGGCMTDCTVAYNVTGTAIGMSEYGYLVRNCIMLQWNGGTGVAWSQGGGSSLKTEAQWLARTGTASTVWCNNCSAAQIGSNCVMDPPKVRRNGRLAPRSPCIGAARALRYESLDLAGNPRVREDGTQDIGCNQWMPSGLMMLVR